MQKDVLRSLLSRPDDAHKYDFGHVLVIGGSEGMAGAPLLAARAALRTGAGLVTIASSVSVVDKLEARSAELMTWRLPEATEAALDFAASKIRERKVSAVVLGPGSGSALKELFKDLLPGLRVPVVLDAGALSLLEGNLALLDRASAANPGIILTPHAGEYARLTGEKTPDGAGEAKRLAAEFATAHRVTLVLKRHHTIVAGAGGVYENTTGNPGMATAGSGDVLSGVIAGLLAQRIAPEAAAQSAVLLQGLSGDIAVRLKTQPALIASDIIDFLPEAFKSLQ